MSKIVIIIDEAIRKGEVDPDNITPSDLRRIGIKPTTSGNVMSNYSKEFECIKRGVYRRKRITKTHTLDSHEVTIELFPSVIRVKDENKNIIRIDKRKGFFIIDLKGNFEFGRDNLRA